MSGWSSATPLSFRYATVPTFGESRRECPGDWPSAHRAAGRLPRLCAWAAPLEGRDVLSRICRDRWRVATAGEIANDRCTMPDTTLRSGRWGNELSFVSTCCLMHDDVGCGAGEYHLQIAAKARVTVEHAEQGLFFRPSVGCRGGSRGGAALLERRARSWRAIA
jgi:hypothetical protein